MVPSSEGAPIARIVVDDDPDYRVGASALASAVGASDAFVLARTALALFTPGCVVAGKLDAGLTLLEEVGFEPVFARVVALSEEKVRRLWKDRLDDFDSERRALIFDLLLAGPSFLVLARDTTEAGPNAAVRLSMLKGPADPMSATADQLRSRLGAANMIINLLHSSAQPADVLRETAILLHPDDLLAAWTAAREPRGLEESRAIWPLMLGGARWAGVSLSHVCVLLRCRLLDALAPWLSSSQLAEMTDLLGRELEWARAADPACPRSALRDFRRVFAGLRLGAWLEPTRGLAGAEEPSLAMELRRVWEEVEDVLHTGDCQLDRLRGASQKAGFFIDCWDWLVVATEAISTRNRA